MFNLKVLSFLVGSAAALPGTVVSPTKPISSLLPKFLNFDTPGASSELIAGTGNWHWSSGGSVPVPNAGNAGSCIQIQHKFPKGTNGPKSESASRAAAVKKAYVTAWNEYAKYAFGSDGFNPISMTGSGGSGNWGLIIIDGFDTAVTMGLKNIADRQLNWIASQDFNATTDPMIDGFDTTIRLIGGLLSGYDLITSGLVPHASAYNKTQVKALLEGARTLADFIAPIFDTDTGLPYFWINTTTREGFAGPSNTASDGTIILEYHRLSDLTGDPKYSAMADKAESYLLKPKPTPKYPGIVGGNVDMNTGKFTNEAGGWHSGIDSFYEYLIKSYIYDPTQEFAQQYKNFWTTAVDSTKKHLAVHPYQHPELTFITVLNNTGFPEWQMDDYSCFAGGNFLLGGAYLSRADYIELGLATTDSCHALYNTTTSGLNPLTIGWYGPNNQATDPAYNGNSSEAQAARQYFEKNGYFIEYDNFGALYTLYPEPIESMMYAWRITGDTKWQDYAWEVFQAIRTDGHRPPVAMSSLYNVSEPMGGDQFPDLPSYYFAETLKYLYLIFAPTNLVSLDDFVFNTECHPLRVQKGTCSTA